MDLDFAPFSDLCHLHFHPPPITAFRLLSQLKSAFDQELNPIDKPQEPLGFDPILCFQISVPSHGVHWCSQASRESSHVFPSPRSHQRYFFFFFSLANHVRCLICFWFPFYGIYTWANPTRANSFPNSKSILWGSIIFVQFFLSVVLLGWFHRWCGFSWHVDREEDRIFGELGWEGSDNLSWLYFC